MIQFAFGRNTGQEGLFSVYNDAPCDCCQQPYWCLTFLISHRHWSFGKKVFRNKEYIQLYDVEVCCGPLFKYMKVNCL
jgi:hypothetical protein